MILAKQRPGIFSNHCLCVWLYIQQCAGGKKEKYFSKYSVSSDISVWLYWLILLQTGDIIHSKLFLARGTIVTHAHIIQHILLGYML